MDHQSDFDRYTRAVTPAVQAFMLEKYHRVQAYSSYFDRHTRWYPRAWEYHNVMTVKPGGLGAGSFPDWVLRDSAARRLYVDFNCAGGSCPRYAADVGDPVYRNYWVGTAARTLATHHYRGLWVDDVNLDWRVSNGNGRRLRPMNPRTGRPMSLGEWRASLVTLLEELRATVPQAEIVHNSIWYAEPGPWVNRQIRAADYINIERGFVDYGITGGRGKFGFRTMLDFIGQVHALGRQVILDTKKRHLSEREFDYAIATYLLITDGRDILGIDDRQRAGPGGWDRRLDVELGEASGPYVHAGDYRADLEGLYLRLFERGVVYVNAPGAPVRTVAGRTLTPMSGFVLPLRVRFTGAADHRDAP